MNRRNLRMFSRLPSNIYWLAVCLFLVVPLASCVETPGPAGPQGQPGPPGASGVIGYEYVDVEVSIGDMEQHKLATGTAKCTPGKKVLGGGGYLLFWLENLGEWARAAWPIRNSEPWHDVGWNFATMNPHPSVASNAKLHVIAICADVSP